MPSRHRPELVLATLFPALFSALIAVVWAWKNPGTPGKPVSQAEDDVAAHARSTLARPEPSPASNASGALR